RERRLQRSSTRNSRARSSGSARASASLRLICSSSRTSATSARWSDAAKPRPGTTTIRSATDPTAARFSTETVDNRGLSTMTDFHTHTGYGGWHAKGLNAGIYDTLREILDANPNTEQSKIERLYVTAILDDRDLSRDFVRAFFVNVLAAVLRERERAGVHE